LAPVILVIEDEPGIVDFLQRGLESQGFEVRAELDGDSGVQRALRDRVDLLILDLMLPSRSGHEVLASVHEAKPELPVIVLTALDQVEQRVAGLDAGAVDYLTKPFSLHELAARIRAQLRVASQTQRTVLRGANVEVDLITREVRYDGEPVRLSTTEFELLTYLMRNHDQALSREQILRAVWGYQYDPGTNVVDVYVGYLRRKLRAAAKDDAGAAPRSPIVTVRSVGYRFDATAS
jgi:DNA-binding response OmpR family regulator